MGIREGKQKPQAMLMLKSNAKWQTRTPQRFTSDFDGSWATPSDSRIGRGTEPG